jgi:hypothetical protein
MATQNPYSDSLLADAFRGSLSNLESLGRGFAVAPVGLLGDVNALAREYITPRLPSSVQGLLQQMPAAPTTERILSNIPRVSAPRMETAGMEQLGAAMNPRGPVDLARGAGRLAGSAINEAMVYGRGPLAAITPQPMRAVQPSIVREGNPIQSAVVLIGDRIFTGRTHGDALNRAVYEGVVRKEGGKFIYPKGAEVDSDLFMTKDGQIIDRLQASKMFDIGASETAIEKGLMQNKPPSSMSIDSYIEQAKAIKQQQEKPSFTYPQEEAMRLAQQRAALPVEQGGLGLAADNTAAERAAAMGFDKDVYHGAQNEITNIDFALAGQNTGNPNATLGFFTTPNTEEASRYATLHGNKTSANVIPLVAKSENSYQMPYKELDDLSMAQYNLMMQSPDYNPNEVVKFGDMAAQKAAAERLKKYRDIASEKSLQRKNELMQEGFDSATVLQGKPMEEFIIFNPDSIRSRFAAFDPFRRNAAIAAAMGVAAPNLLAQEQPQSAGLLYPLP